MKIIDQNILTMNTKYICHQCNCVSKSGSGLAHYLFETFPHADVYSNRAHPDRMGDIIVCGDGINDRYVINMMAQYYPGYANAKYANDSERIRLNAFTSCLGKILEIPNLESIAFPYGVGCGLGGGDWGKYLSMLEWFSTKTNAEVTICKFEG